MNIIQEIDREQINALLAKRGVPAFEPVIKIGVAVEGAGACAMSHVPCPDSCAVF